jgi:L-amino acid N-acyltransferase YncA
MPAAVDAVATATGARADRGKHLAMMVLDPKSSRPAAVHKIALSIYQYSIGVLSLVLRIRIFLRYWLC